MQKNRRTRRDLGRYLRLLDMGEVPDRAAPALRPGCRCRAELGSPRAPRGGWLAVRSSCHLGLVLALVSRLVMGELDYPGKWSS